MSKAELTGKRDLTYSHAHRGHRTGHPNEGCCSHDIDSLDHCCACGEWLLLVETAEETGRERLRDHKYLKWGAERLRVPAVLIWYERGTSQWCDTCSADFDEIEKLYVRYVHRGPRQERVLSWDEWANEIEQHHEHHQCP